MSDLNDLSRADLVQAAKAAGVRASGKSEDIIDAIEAKRAEGPASSSVDGDSGDQSRAAAHPGDAAGAEPFTPPPADQSAETVEPEASDERVAPAATGDVLPINRETDAAWWCPNCDNSQTHTLQECGGCGAVRDGDVVVVP